jgi:hypothetical protein
MSCSTSSPTSSPGRVDAAGYTDLRPGHGCVFGTIDPEGSRLTDLAERAGMTKQTVGEVTSDLENPGLGSVPVSDVRSRVRWWTCEIEHAESPVLALPPRF